MNKAKGSLCIFFALVIVSLSYLASKVIEVDPFFHYHYPLTEEYYYPLDNERSMNNGIIRHFNYDALITGTSVTQNFKSSELDRLFGVNSIKVCFAGGRYKEINENIEAAFGYNPSLKLVVRGIDGDMLFYDKDEEISLSGGLPRYLYDDSYLNDAAYLFNRDVLFGRICPMSGERYDNWYFKPGITSFDDYSSWRDYTFGAKTLCKEKSDEEAVTVGRVEITEEEKETVAASIRRNVTAVAAAHPDAEFYYFFPPYSAIWWQDVLNRGELEKYLEAEKIAIEEMLKYDNIKLFSFNNALEITADLNNYKDSIHYGEWINSLLLKYMKDGKYRLTKDNYLSYLEEEFRNYSQLDYSALASQTDFNNDYYADALLREKYTGIAPVEFLKLDNSGTEIKKAQRKDGTVYCTQTVQPVESFNPDSVLNDFSGIKQVFLNEDNHRYLVFDAEAGANTIGAGVYIFEKDWGLVSYTAVEPGKGTQQYLIDLGNFGQEITVLFAGGYVESNAVENTVTKFENIWLF